MLDLGVVVHTKTYLPQRNHWMKISCLKLMVASKTFNSPDSVLLRDATLMISLTFKIPFEPHGERTSVLSFAVSRLVKGAPSSYSGPSIWVVEYFCCCQSPVRYRVLRVSRTMRSADWVKK